MYVYVSFPNRQKHKCFLSTRGCPPHRDSLNNNHSLLWSRLCLLESSTSTSSSTTSRQKEKNMEEPIGKVLLALLGDTIHIPLGRWGQRPTSNCKSGWEMY